MTHDQKQSALGRFFASRMFLIVSLVIVSIFALGFARAYYQDYTVRQEINQLEQEVSQLEQKKLESLDMLNYVMSDEYVEDKARTELNMKKPGERMLFVEHGGDGTSDTAGDVDQSTDGQILSNPVKWIYYFTHKDLPQGS